MVRQSEEYIKKYKQEYYKKNIDKYTERNTKATRERRLLRQADNSSEEELCHMIELLSTDDIIYKLNYIVENDKKIEEEKNKPIVKTKKRITVIL